MRIWPMNKYHFLFLRKKKWSAFGLLRKEAANRYGEGGGKMKP
jgi:hypothetical protein